MQKNNLCRVLHKIHLSIECSVEHDFMDINCGRGYSAGYIYLHHTLLDANRMSPSPPYAIFPAHHAVLSYHLRTSSDTQTNPSADAFSHIGILCGRSLLYNTLLMVLMVCLNNVQYLISSTLPMLERLSHDDLNPISHVQLIDGHTPHLNPMISLTFSALCKLLQ